MSAVLENFPGAQLVLFQWYHMGGCNSCGILLALRALADRLEHGEPVPVSDELFSVA